MGLYADYELQLSGYLERISRMLNDTRLHQEERDSLRAEAVAGFEMLPPVKDFYRDAFGEEDDKRMTFRQLRKNQDQE